MQEGMFSVEIIGRERTNDLKLKGNNFRLYWKECPNSKNIKQGKNKIKLFLIEIFKQDFQVGQN